ncbi:hypothetical protein DIPPA_31223 [Diplonema papillatum]|nr:hypothetical protein DIPPA_31223 [Diplonema papillatum]
MGPSALKVRSKPRCTSWPLVASVEDKVSDYATKAVRGDGADAQTTAAKLLQASPTSSLTCSSTARQCRVSAILNSTVCRYWFGPSPGSVVL